MTRLLRVLLPALALSAPVAVHAQQAAQQVRVLTDQTTVWSPGFRGVETVVRAGTVLTVVRRQEEWFEVELPSVYGERKTGMIAATRVELVGGPGGPAAETTAPPVPQAPPGSAPRAPAAPGTRPRGQAARRAAGAAHLQVFGSAGYGWFQARDSFKAVLGQDGGPWFGGGARVEAAGGLFVEGSVDRFQATGERVFVFEGEAFPLGVETRVAITPVMGTAGYTFRSGDVSTYLGGGVGTYLYRETSDFADSGENISQSHLAYRGVLGAQWRVARRWWAGVELLYTRVPNALEGGAAAAFDESDLGGVQLRGRILFGR